MLPSLRSILMSTAATVAIIIGAFALGGVVRSGYSSTEPPAAISRGGGFTYLRSEMERVATRADLATGTASAPDPQSPDRDLSALNDVSIGAAVAAIDARVALERLEVLSPTDEQTARDFPTEAAAAPAPAREAPPAAPEPELLPDMAATAITPPDAAADEPAAAPQATTQPEPAALATPPAVVAAVSPEALEPAATEPAIIDAVDTMAELPLFGHEELAALPLPRERPEMIATQASPRRTARTRTKRPRHVAAPVQQAAPPASAPLPNRSGIPGPFGGG
ncbi:MAG TPA: hypothetical protein VNQ99_03550 [Xanthobacteraceae bacterium]|nr:hypothetical protein [Xanthobacteraceae bacterium]